MKHLSTSGTNGWDPILRHLLAAPTRKEAEREFDRLHRDILGTVIDRVLSEETGRDMPTSHDELNDEADIFEDLSILVRGRIAIRLLGLWDAYRQGKIDRNGSIGNLHGYVVAAARNACVDYIRQEHPGRHALDNSLRATLAKRTDVSLWKVVYPEGHVEWWCGWTVWRDDGTAPASIDNSTALTTSLKRELEGVSHKAALARVFEVVGHPLRFNELLGFLSQYWDVERRYQQQSEEMVPFRVPKQYQRLQPDQVVELIGTLQSIWGQVRRLAPNQAAVLLLKATPLEYGDFLEVMVDLNIADWPVLARTVGLSVERIRLLSPDVPLDDGTIADLIGVTVEDVPRIRQDARRRLKRQNDRVGRQSHRLNSPTD